MQSEAEFSYEDRYGKTGGNRWVAYAFGFAIVGLLWIFWAGLHHANPAISNQLISFEVTGEKEISIREMERNIIAPLADKYVYDKILVNEFKEELSFWIARNDYMVKRILEVTRNQNGKKIIVLTGLAHKYYLVEKLRNEPWISLN